MDDEKLILDVIHLGKSKIRIIGAPEEFISVYSYHILNLENYDYMHINYNPSFKEGYDYDVSIIKGGQNLLSLSEAVFHQFQTFIDLNILLDLEPGTIEGLFLEAKMQYS